jgi:2-amino-4-hydroxy-6-hydroxymethyldihydropteridine diphosphokinase
VADAFLGLGSNLGDRHWHLAEAVHRLHSPAEVSVVAASSVYETAPVGYTNQPHFLNAVIQLATAVGPEELLRRCLAVEQALGRVRRDRWGPRTIDIDVLWYDSVTRDDATLTLPHPRMHERAFVLIPLAEVAPNLMLRGESVAALAAKFAAEPVRRVGELRWEKAGRLSRAPEEAGPT